MKPKSMLLVGLLGVGVVATRARADDQKAHSGHGTAGHMEMGGKKGSGELHGKMVKAAAEMRTMKMTGDVDHDFVMAMKRHHEQGIEMAQIVLRDGKDPQAKQFAEKVVAEQRKDVAEFDAWLKAHRPAAAKGTAGTTAK